MRILICNYEYPPLGGGGGVSTRFLATELVQRHAVTVLTSGGPGLPRETIEDGGVRVVRVRAAGRRHAAVSTVPSMLSYVVLGLLAGRRLLQREAYDIVNTHFVLPTGPVGDRLARMARIPNVLTVHGGDLYDPSKRLSPHRHPALRLWIRHLLRRADAVVGQSRDTVENIGIYAHDVLAARIPLGIPPPASGPPGARAAFGCGEDEVILVTIGRLVPRKAVHQLLDVMARLRDRPVRLLVVGSGPEEGALQAQICQLGLNHRVQLVGQLTDVEKFQLLSVADLYVSTSQHEGFGLVFLEAMASGLPVLAYDHGGQSDFLGDGETGYLVPLNDLDTFVDRCRRLVEDAALRRALGQQAIAVAENLSIARCARRYETMFDRALAANGRVGERAVA